MSTVEETLADLKKQLDSLAQQIEQKAPLNQEEFNERVDTALSRARQQWESTRKVMQEKGTEAKENLVAAGQKADQYVHDNPWQTAAFSAAVGLIIGVLINRSRD